MSSSDKPIAKINDKYANVKLKYTSYVPECVAIHDSDVIKKVAADKHISWYLIFTG